MSVHYKFKSTLNFDTITFDGLHISVGDLKREIVQQKRLGKIIDFDLQITNAQSKEEYKDDGVLIPKNTTLIISRIPIAHPTKKGWEPPAAENAFSSAPAKQDNFNMDLSKMQGTEEDKIQAMMMQSTVDYDPKTYHRIKGQSQVGEVPASYRCNKCKKSGHWIKNCPFVGGKDQQEVKRNTGIPRSFRDKPDAAENESADFVLPAVQNQEIPEDLICGICRDIFVDAVMIPCCGSSFCDDCVRTSLLESEDSECPDCKEKNCSPGSLIPNRFLRNSVNAFKNETGYNKSAAKPAAVKNEEKPPVEKEVEKKPVAEVEPEETEVKPEKQKESETNGSNPPKSESPEPPATTEPSQKEKDKYDSDYEDNITIKMPQPAADSTTVPSKRSPSYSHRSESSHRRDRSDYVSDHDHKHQRPSKSESVNKDRSLLPLPIGTLPSYQGHMMAESEEARRSSAYKPPYMQMQRGPPPMHMMSHHMPAYNNGFNNMGQRPPLSYVPYQNQSVHPMRAPYGSAGGGMNMNMSQPFQSPNLASIYQGVAAKVGSGPIDDPLEAFNRIMKEKERKKVDRFRSSDRHRSRSPDRQRHRFKSPMYEKDNSRDNLKDKRPRSRERKREHSYERHIRHPRSSRQPNDGSKSPGGRIKRSGHRRSASPKPGYKSDYRDKPYNKPSAPKTEAVEPPPPGFEPLQLTDEDGYRNKHPTSSEASQSSKGDSSKKRGENRHEEAPRKRHRSRSISKEPKPNDSNYRSLTPPAKITTPKMTAAQLRQRESSPKTPEKSHDDYLTAKARIMASQPVINDTEMETNVGKENKAKSPLSKDRKKKKKDKDKAERKKNKKDKRAKKEKGDRQKKSSSVNRSDSDINNSSLMNESNYKVLSPRAQSPSIEINAAQLSPTHNATENVNPKSHSILTVGAASDDNLGPRSKLSEANSVNLSKWEIDENILGLEDSSKKAAGASDDPSEITSDVLRKAENAIFAKAINAIRPMEFQVIINSKDNSKDRSVVRSDKDRSSSPRRNNSSRSVKDRLGTKISNDRSRSRDKSKGRRRAARSSDDDANRGRSDRHGSRKRDNRSRDRAAPSEKRQERSYKRSSPEDDKLRRQNKERSESKHGKHDQNNSDDSDRRAAKNTKSSDSRVVSSVTAVVAPPKPCRPDNPFRKFVDTSSSSSLVVKYDNTIQKEGASSDNGMEHRKQRDKKLKKHSKYSSTDSLKSEKRKDPKSKKKSKILKKKKKSKK